MGVLGIQWELNINCKLVLPMLIISKVPWITEFKQSQYFI